MVKSRSFNKKNLTRDISVGIVTGLVSIPISMGYAQISGLPPVYGLYGSIIPVLIWCIITTSRQTFFGVDATPAALVGGLLADIGIASGSKEAMMLVPAVTMCVTAWLLILCLLRAGKAVKYVSAPVMGGFVSGIGMTVILMQIPKLFGGSAGCGEVLVLVNHIIAQALENFHLLSFMLGVITVLIIKVSGKINSKFPMSVVMIIIGAILTKAFHLSDRGVKLLPEVAAGLPFPSFPDMSLVSEYGDKILAASFTIAIVIVSQTLLISNNLARKYDYAIDPDRELMAFGVSNFASGLFGCPPMNGSVSRTGLGEQYGARSQVMSLTAVATMLAVLFFGTGLLELLPVPMLTGIVISALMSILEFGMACMLYRTDKKEFLIFMGAFLGVVIFGTIYGVLIGVALSFTAVLIRTISVPRAYLGVVPGQDVFINMARHSEARPIRNTLIYRFSGNLYFANVDILEKDIDFVVQSEKDTDEPIKIIVIDARGVGSVDFAAADALLKMYRRYSSIGIKFYITEHSGFINDQFRMYGAGELVTKGVSRRTITLALRDAGLHAPYDYSENRDFNAAFEGLGKSQLHGSDETDTHSRKAEMEWAFGDASDDVMEQIASEWITQIAGSDDYSIDNILKAEQHTEFGRVGLFDEDEILIRMEKKIRTDDGTSGIDADKLMESIEERRRIIAEKVKEIRL
ncbi:MAG: SulP family inorganic anion transporter [Lachnospiraceae bacterium]|nr:SulP family inorganic anion transporter [Lachnospiraceae bacterium]